LSLEFVAIRRLLSLCAAEFHLALTSTCSLPPFFGTGLFCLAMTETTHRKRGGKPFHSILEPHFDFIRELRQRRRTWKEIAESLFSEKGIHVTFHAPYLFYRRQLRRRAKGHWENEVNQVAAQPPTSSNAASSRPQKRLSPLPPKSNFKQPDREKINTEQEFT
jgi:hypothetical protein